MPAVRPCAVTVRRCPSPFQLGAGAVRVKPASFRYVAATSVDEALAAKARHGDDARFLAGGQSLIPAMNFRLAQPAVLIDLNPIPGLGEPAVEAGGALRIPALVRHRTLADGATVARHQPLVREAAREVAHPQIRNRGTLCGNLAHADPASELPAVMVALGASMHLRSVRGERRVAAQDFFRGIFATALEPDELLAAVTLPALPPRTGTGFLEIARRHGDYPMMGVAAVVTLDAGGRCLHAALVCCNAGETPRAASRASAVLREGRLDDAAIGAAAALVAGEIDPRGSVHASPAYQRHLATVLARRALQLAAQRAREAA